jgi:hypothetical protein
VWCVKIQLSKDGRTRSCQRFVSGVFYPLSQPISRAAACCKMREKFLRLVEVFKFSSLMVPSSKFCSTGVLAATMAASRSSSNSSGSVGKELRLCFYGCGLIAEHHVVAVQRCREAGEVESAATAQCRRHNTNAMHDEPFSIASCSCICIRMATAHRPAMLALHTSTHLCCSFRHACFVLFFCWCGHLYDRFLHLAMHQPFASWFCVRLPAEGRATVQ